MGFVYDSVEPFSTRGIMELLLVFFFFFNGYFHVAFNDDQTKYFVPVFFFLHLRLVPWLDSSIEGEKKKQASYGMFKFSMVVRDNNNNRSKNRKKIEVSTSFFILTKLYSSIKTIGSIRRNKWKS